VPLQRFCALEGPTAARLFVGLVVSSSSIAIVIIEQK
jgi:hypothetical protein